MAMSTPDPVRDRKVLLAAATVVAGVGAVALLAALVPPVGDLLRLAPVVVVVLIVVTLAVLIRSIGEALRRR